MEPLDRKSGRDPARKVKHPSRPGFLSRIFRVGKGQRPDVESDSSSSASQMLAGCPEGGSGSPNPDTDVRDDSHATRSLWDHAYSDLEKDKPSLIAKYEILLSSESQKTSAYH